jgi:hypothetical protein
VAPEYFAPGGLRVFSILFAFDSVVISVAMPMMLNDNNFLVMMSAPVAVVVTIAITLYDNRVLGIRRSVRKSDRRNTKSNNSYNEISHSCILPIMDVVALIQLGAVRCLRDRVEAFALGTERG